jgi:hypothetical protein
MYQNIDIIEYKFFIVLTDISLKNIKVSLSCLFKPRFHLQAFINPAGKKNFFLFHSI